MKERADGMPTTQGKGGQSENSHKLRKKAKVMNSLPKRFFNGV